MGIDIILEKAHIDWMKTGPIPDENWAKLNGGETGINNELVGSTYPG
jgi:hypothetical protein